MTLYCIPDVQLYRYVLLLNVSRHEPKPSRNRPELKPKFEPKPLREKPELKPKPEPEYKPLQKKVVFV